VASLRPYCVEPGVPVVVLELVPNEAELLRRTAGAIEQGKVVGWFQGRMEWGPRALGARRSFAISGDMKTVL
jgi:predicted NodU family carbamoyl transferase